MEAACAASALVGLVFNCATAFKTCNDLRGKYKRADQTLQSITTEASTLQLCLNQLQHLMQRDPAALSSRWIVEPMLPQTFETVIESFQRMILSLLEELEKVTGRRTSSSDGCLVRSSKVKLLWNEAAMQGLLRQIHAHQQSLQFLLHILQISSISEIREGIQENRTLLKSLELSAKNVHQPLSKPPKRKSGTQNVDESSTMLHKGTSTNSVATDVEGPSDWSEPPPKRRSLSPEENSPGVIPTSSARLRSGAIFRPTTSRNNGKDRQLEPPVIEGMKFPQHGTKNSGDSILVNPTKGPSHGTSAKNKSRRRTQTTSQTIRHSLSPEFTQEIQQPDQPVTTKSLYATIESDDYNRRRKKSQAVLPSPINSTLRSRSTRSPSTVSPWWKFELWSPPRTPNRQSKTPETSERRRHRRRHRKEASREDTPYFSYQEESESADPRTTKVGQSRRASLPAIEPHERREDESPKPVLTASSGLNGDNDEIIRSGKPTMDAVSYTVRQREPLVRIHSSVEVRHDNPVPDDAAFTSGKEDTQPETKREDNLATYPELESIPEKRVASQTDAKKHRIPDGYSLKNWDPIEEPIFLLGSVFDAKSLGKWIYDWTVYSHGAETSVSSIAQDFKYLLSCLFDKLKRAEECVPRIRDEENRELMSDFIEAGERLTLRLQRLLKACEAPMLRAGKYQNAEKKRLDKIAGEEFVVTIFGEGPQSEMTDALMSAIRLWNLRFDANCEEILQALGA